MDHKKLETFVARIARMNWDGEEREGEDVEAAVISNDDYHDTMVALIMEARRLVQGAS